MDLTCEAGAQRSWRPCICPSASLSRCPVLCRGWQRLGACRCRSVEKPNHVMTLDQIQCYLYGPLLQAMSADFTDAHRLVPVSNLNCRGRLHTSSDGWWFREMINIVFFSSQNTYIYIYPLQGKMRLKLLKSGEKIDFHALLGSEDVYRTSCI